MKKNFVKSLFNMLKVFIVALFFLFLTYAISGIYVEPYAYNYMARAFIAQKQAANDVVIIAIDDKSIAYHRWPWPRDYYGKIIRYLRDYTNAKVIGFDSIIQNLDAEHKQSDEIFFNDVKNTPNLVVGFCPLAKGVFDEERNSSYVKKFNKKFKTKITLPLGGDLPKSLYHGISEFPAEYFDAVKNVGSVNDIEHPHDFVREKAMLQGVNEDYYPALALKMYMIMNNVDELSIDEKFITAEGTPLKIPYVYDNEGAFLTNIRYYGLRPNSAYSHIKYSASDIIKSYESLQRGENPIINPKEFDGKIVFIGSNAKAAAVIEDVSQTPLQKAHPGVDIQATSFDNLLNNDYVKESSATTDFGIIIIILAITFIAIIKTSVPVSLSLIGLSAAAYLTYVVFCYLNAYAVPITAPYMLQVTTAIFGYSYRFVLEGRNKEKIKQAMGKYLSQDIMKNVVKNIDDIKLGGKRAIVTVLFADIRGFTSISEKLSAEEISVILNEYFTEIEPIITRYNGVINKFIGDAVMAIFGEPIQDLNHPVNAVKCAYAMLKKVEELQDKWLFEGKPKIEIGIGINTGEAFVGNIGSEKRLEYTVIGDTVNLASRIESYNKIYHTNLLVSTSTYSYVSDIANVIKISDVTIRGKSRKMDIYEILKLNEK